MEWIAKIIECLRTIFARAMQPLSKTIQETKILCVWDEPNSINGECETWQFYRSVREPVRCINPGRPLKETTRSKAMHETIIITEFIYNVYCMEASIRYADSSWTPPYLNTALKKLPEIWEHRSAWKKNIGRTEWVLNNIREWTLLVRFLQRPSLLPSITLEPASSARLLGRLAVS